VLYPNVDRLEANGKKIFAKLAARIELFKNEVSDPDWGICLGALAYYAEKFQVFCSAISELDRDDLFFIARF
jgi:hypothetical protein